MERGAICDYDVHSEKRRWQTVASFQSEDVENNEKERMGEQNK